MRRAALLFALLAVLGCKKKKYATPYPYSAPPTYTMPVTPPPVTPATTTPGPVGPPAPPTFPKADFLTAMQLERPGTFAVGKTAMIRMRRVGPVAGTLRAVPCKAPASKSQFALDFDLALEPKVKGMTDADTYSCPRVHFSIEDRTNDLYKGRVLAVLP